MLIAYASRTGTRRNLAALRDAGWRLLVSAAGCLRNEGFPYALDNGAWSSYQQGRPFDEPAFVRALRKLGAGADWTTLPDIVAGGHASLDLSLRWGLWRQVSLKVDAKNLLDTPFLTTQRAVTRLRYTVGRTMVLGFTWAP